MPYLLCYICADFVSRIADAHCGRLERPQTLITSETMGLIQSVEILSTADGIAETVTQASNFETGLFFLFPISSAHII
jgi:coenzyme F420-reducing hydrogenase beta subunit